LTLSSLCGIIVLSSGSSLGTFAVFTKSFSKLEVQDAYAALCRLW
jgi:hypothetical protein